jgi:hypothetical protein
MNLQLHRWRLVLHALVVALILTALPALAGADDTAKPAARPGLRSLTTKVDMLKAPAPARARAQSAGVTKAPLESRSFFKKPIGVIVLAVFAAGTGYTIYSAKHDRVPPQGR